jgi:transcriptional regulator with XRE-family HTH domain
LSELLASSGSVEGSELRACRVSLGFTQRQFAKELGVAPNTLARWERGVLAIRRPALLRLAL